MDKIYMKQIFKVTIGIQGTESKSYQKSKGEKKSNHGGLEGEKKERAHKC